MVSRFVTGGTVKQDGICLLPPPPPHYRMVSPQRSEAFQVGNTASSYVSQTQGPHQGSGFAVIPSPRPPNQSSTPPNPDLKVQGMPPLFMHNQVRAQAYYQNRTAGTPSNQTSRMPGQQHRPQGQVYNQLYIQYMPPQMYFNQNRPSSMIPPHYTPQAVYSPALPYSSFPQQASPASYQMYTYGQNPTPIMQRTSMTPTASAPPNSVPVNMQSQVPPPHNQNHNTYPRNSQKTRRPNALSVINPKTGEDCLKDMFEERTSNPASADSSARQTPQPAPPNNNKEVQAMFAKQVAQRINDDKPHEEEPPLPEPHSMFHMPPEHQVQVQVLPSVPVQYDVPSSTLHYTGKEFVSSLNKESTPIVSANSDAAEVILQKKDRESPVKGRRHSPREQKPEVPKEPLPSKETEKVPAPVLVKEEKHLPPPAPVIAPTVPVVEAIPAVPVVPVVVKEPPKETEKKPKKQAEVEQAQPQPPQPQPQPIEIPVVNNGGKSKNSNRSKPNVQQNAKPQPTAQPQPPQQQLPQHAAPQQTQPQPQSQAPPPVPAPQPPKSNNRSNKTKELNLKGASKEGTDMDAFNDNAAKAEINANQLPPSNDTFTRASDTANANSVPQPIVSDSTYETENLVNLNSQHKKVDSNENVTTIKPEPAEANAVNNVTAPTPAPILPKPANKPFDVTSIIKDTPKPITTPSSFPVNENNEDGDNSASHKTPVGAKVSMENAINTIKSSKLPYRKGQWRPDDPAGEKVYEKDFLLALRHVPPSKKKPEHILEAVQMDDRSRILPDSRLGRTDFTTPPFSNYGGKSSSQRGTLPKRGSQGGKMGSRSGDKNASKPQAKVSISLRADVKLHEAENAWKPARFLKGETPNDEEKKNEELYKKVRSVLNKLTPQKFETLVNQFRKLQIDTKERLQRVIDLVFDKAIDEPNFSVAYAMMCKELQIMAVPGEHGADEKKSVAFRTLLVTRCQNEFEKQSVDESLRNTKVQVIDRCTDLEKKKELTFELEEYDRRLRMKSVGTIRFIGELFKQQMLTANIMLRCLQSLLKNKDDESLECLCKLLTTVGKELEFNKRYDLESIFEEMKRIAEGKKQKVGSRIKFMLQDVIDLKDSKWVPRRSDTNPKTIDQIQKEAENEHLNIAVNTPRKDDRSNGSRGGGGGGGPRQKISEDGWSSVSSRTRSVPFSVQADKMRVKMPENDARLGDSSMFGSWVRGSGGPKNVQSSFGSNMYAALENIDPDRRTISSRNKEPYHSKGPSLERSYKSSYDGRGSRSGSQHRDNTGPMRTGPPPSMSSLPPSIPPQQHQPKPFAQPAPVPLAPAAAPASEIGEEKLLKLIHNSLAEYLNDCCNCQVFYQDLGPSLPAKSLSRFVFECFNYVLEKSQQSRLKVSVLFAYLLKTRHLSFEIFSAGFEEYLSYSEDLVIDIPQIWHYIAEQLVHLILEEALSFQSLHKLLGGLIKCGAAKKILKSLFGLVIKEKGPNFLLTVWKQSNIQLSDFMPENEVSSFVSENKLEFLNGGGAPIGQSALSYEEIQRKLTDLLKKQAPFDDVVNWISANVGERKSENEFIRVFATAIFESSIQKNKLVDQVLSGHGKLIQKYIDNNTAYELQCLYSLQALINKREHPQGLLLAICNRLYEDSIFCQESFVAWEASQDPAEQEGKGVALKQLTSFFTQLRENEEDDYSDSDEA